MSLAAAPEDEKVEEKEETPNAGQIISDELLMPAFNKAKSYTPMPGRRQHASSQNAGGHHPPGRPFILGVSTSHISFLRRQDLKVSHDWPDVAFAILDQKTS